MTQWTKLYQSFILSLMHYTVKYKIIFSFSQWYCLLRADTTTDRNFCHAAWMSGVNSVLKRVVINTVRQSPKSWKRS